MPRVSADRVRRALLFAAATLMAAFMPARVPAQTVSLADCREAYLPYSSASLLMDLLLDPRTHAVLDAQHVLDGVPEPLRSSVPPSFTSILTPAALIGSTRLPFGDHSHAAERIAALDAALATIPVDSEAAVRRCARYDHTGPALPVPDRHPAVLLFGKVTGYRDAPSIEAARTALQAMALREHWFLAETENGTALTDPTLDQYDVLVWNNVSGDVLTLPQEAGLQRFLDQGGGWAGIHGAGGDPIYVWDWYADVLVGARFIGHPMQPQFQSAFVRDERPGVSPEAPGWTMTEEWYSFAASPRGPGFTVLASLDEATYAPGLAMAMGDHPIAWRHCIGAGRSFYTAIGHRPDSYLEPHSLELLAQGIGWAADRSSDTCHVQGKSALSSAVTAH